MELSIYGNCQSSALAKTLFKNKSFMDAYDYVRLKPVHTIKKDYIDIVKDIFKRRDLLIYQEISDNYYISELSTSKLLKHRPANSKNISIPSLYFNAYFPHLDKFPGDVISVLNKVHDYIIMYSYTKGLSEKETLDLIQSENLYPKKISLDLLEQSLNNLKEREEKSKFDIAISTFIQNNFQDIKLFNQYNHPRGIVFDYLANQIFDILNFPRIEESILSKTPLDNVTIAPIYKSTYLNLNLKFKEDFSLYLTKKGKLQQDEVVSGFFKTYKEFNKKELENIVSSKKAFIVDIFNYHDI